jgi:hypothetical protein
MDIKKLPKLGKRGPKKVQMDEVATDFRREVSGKAGVHASTAGLPNVKKNTKRFFNLMKKINKKGSV